MVFCAKAQADSNSVSAEVTTKYPEYAGRMRGIGSSSSVVDSTFALEDSSELQGEKRGEQRIAYEVSVKNARETE